MLACLPPQNQYLEARWEEVKFIQGLTMSSDWIENLLGQASCYIQKQRVPYGGTEGKLFVICDAARSVLDKYLFLYLPLEYGTL